MRVAAFLVPFLVAASAAAEEPSETAAPPPSPPSAAPARGLPPATGRAGWLGALVVTRDLELPGSTFALRLIPTRLPVAGTSSQRIVVRADVVQSVVGSDFYGLTLVRHF